jgi:hypothetical protein
LTLLLSLDFADWGNSLGWIYRSDSFARRPILGSADMTMMYFTYRVKFALLGKKMTSRIWQTRLALVVSVVCGTAGIARGESHNNGLMQSNAEYGERDDGSGAFRTHCLETHSSFDDPLVAPGRPDGAHHHVFFGNPTLDAYTSTESFTKTTRTACEGGILNHSGYWILALFDVTGERIKYVDPLFYYKTGYHVPASVIQRPPEGIVIIAGNANAISPQSTTIAKFRCDSWVSDIEWYSSGDPLDHVPYFPNCKIDDLLEFRIVFPQCWDGQNLDIFDHNSHMVYLTEATSPFVGTGKCPSSHPIAIPEISFNCRIYVTEDTGPPTSWRFATDVGADIIGGSSVHADWMNGWDSETMKLIVANCLNTAFECSVGLLGDGTRLRPVVLD